MACKSSCPTLPIDQKRIRFFFFKKTINSLGQRFLGTIPSVPFYSERYVLGSCCMRGIYVASLLLPVG